MTVEAWRRQLKLDGAYEAVIGRVQFDDASETPTAARGVVVGDENDASTARDDLAIMDKLANTLERLSNDKTSSSPGT